MIERRASAATVRPVSILVAAGRRAAILQRGVLLRKCVLRSLRLCWRATVIEHANWQYSQRSCQSREFPPACVFGIWVTGRPVASAMRRALPQRSRTVQPRPDAHPLVPSRWSTGRHCQVYSLPDTRAPISSASCYWLRCDTLNRLRTRLDDSHPRATISTSGNPCADSWFEIHSHPCRNCDSVRFRHSGT
jgi:hypothetical protein